MAVRIFPLANVPDDEARGVRASLADAGIEFYETPPSTPGYLTMSGVTPTEAIWVTNDRDAPAAFAVIEKFEGEWERRHVPYRPLMTPAFRLTSGATKLLLLVIGIVLVLIIGIYAQQ